MQSQTENSVVVALTEDHVARATGLSKSQLRAWDRRGFFSPRHAYDDRRAAYSRIYSFKDVVGLKTIATLRSRYKIGFKKLTRVAEELQKRGFSHWADTKLYVLKRDVHFKDPQTGDIENLRDGQLAMLEVIDVINDITEKISEIKSRPKEKFGSVERNKFVARNSWVISGTRIPTATIRRYSDAGYSVDQIIEEYPSLSRTDVLAALEHEKTLENSA
ncbi:MerR HTH family regulatory protein [Roseovarius azorensis]|uniref:MerR HTH family regulatory protein n=1 Tax=Roseovarius azorensis TaxID=1287727 RepID=A0A1H7N0H5_9RHOB|nr:DUF433 domain-containing protein [Roseovarius azorensis]SEL16831.1 MerR HTH family regulatory protein [Roseovarius azorensis]